MSGSKAFWILGFLSLISTFGTTGYLMSVEKKKAIKAVMALKEEEKKEELPRFWTFRSREIEKLVMDLNARQKVIQKKESEISEIEAYMAAEMKELEASREQLVAMRDKLNKRLIKVEKNEQKNLGELASTYSNLAPDAAVEVFKEMDDILIVKILTNMDPAAVAPIFQAMVQASGNAEFAAQRVARISELMRLKQDETE